METPLRDPLIAMGLLLIAMGLIFLALAAAPRVIPRLQSLPPILYVSIRLDGTSIGTSPIAILILILIYTLLLAKR